MMNNIDEGSTDYQEKRKGKPCHNCAFPAWLAKSAAEGSVSERIVRWAQWTVKVAGDWNHSTNAVHLPFRSLPQSLIYLIRGVSTTNTAFSRRVHTLYKHLIVIDWQGAIKLAFKQLYSCLKGVIRLAFKQLYSIYTFEYTQDVSCISGISKWLYSMPAMDAVVSTASLPGSVRKRYHNVCNAPLQ